MTISQYNFYPILTPVRLLSTSNVAGTYFNGPTNNGVKATLTIAASSLTVDSVVAVLGDRIGLVAQTAAEQNGIYDVFSIGSTVVLQRSDDLNDAENLKPGLSFSVGAGTANGGAVYTLVEPLPASFGIDDMVFESAQSPGGGSGTFSDITVTGTATINNENLSGILTVPNAGLHILDTNASHDLILSPGSDLTADRIFTLTTGDAARTLSVLGNVALDQNLQIADSPTFAGVTLGNEGLHILDTNASHDLVIKPGSDLTADRILTVTTGDAARTLDISAANVTVSTFGASLVDDAAASNARTTLQIFSGVTADIGGGGAGPISVAVAGMSAASAVVATIASSTNTVAVAKCISTATGFDITFDGDPGAACVVNFVAVGA